MNEVNLMQQQFEPSGDPATFNHPALEAERAGSRRGFLGWMGRLGMAVVGGIAGVTALREPALANPGCCDLATSTSCSGDGAGFSCPSGYNKRVWYCASGNTTYGCGECTTGSDCHSGDYACSEVWAEG
jgi:hypothetical protein